MSSASILHTILHSILQYASQQLVATGLHLRRMGLFCIAASVTLSACAGTPSLTPTPSVQLPAVGDAKRGQILFEQGTLEIAACSACHAVVSGGAEKLGPVLQGIAARAGSRVAGEDAEAYLLSSMVAPNAFVVEGYAKGLMQSVTASPQQYKDLITYMLTLN